MTQLDLQQRLARALQELVKHINRNAELVAERDALQQQVNALAAEALYLKDEILQHSQSTHFCKVCGEDDTCVNDDVCWALTHETPTTDAYLNSVRAEGVDMFAKYCWSMEHTRSDRRWVGAARNAELFAEKLRQKEEKAE